ncbi:MAG: hypothetical protein RMN25_12415, partial [Anaerolineae bacterium]|nr:hypothetical protein [Thermoflexales bacterium]MDW8408574.1 hypothetical protein [Anaerolineae bacterium]
QRHSQDMADKGFLDHIGSDGSKLDDRVLMAGYSSWIGRRVWVELVYAGTGGFSEALEFWLSDEAERRHLLDRRLREIGIGVALNTSPAGVTTAYWTLVLGAQPNALPVFINDGAVTTNMPQVAVRLSQEEIVPEGEGNSIGKVIEVRLSADPGFRGAVWQKWEPLVPFTFDDVPGLKTVYVQYRDTSDRMTVATASIQYDPNSTPVVIASGPGEVANTADLDRLPEATPTPGVGNEATPILVTVVVGDNTSSTPATAVQAPTSALLPPTPTPQLSRFAPTAPSPQAAVNLLDRSDPARPDAVLPDWLLPAVATAQAAVIVLGLIALLKRKL